MGWAWDAGGGGSGTRAGMMRPPRQIVAMAARSTSHPYSSLPTAIWSKPSLVMKNGLRVIRTYRRSAETTGVTNSVTPSGIDPICGEKATEPIADRELVQEYRGLGA